MNDKELFKYVFKSEDDIRTITNIEYTNNPYRGDALINKMIRDSYDLCEVYYREKFLLTFTFNELNDLIVRPYF